MTWPVSGGLVEAIVSGLLVKGYVVGQHGFFGNWVRQEVQYCMIFLN